jgi:hypothetical protein
MTDRVRVEQGLPELVRWYLDAQDPVPLRLVLRDVYDRAGYPEWAPDFRRWVYGAQTTRLEVEEGACSHPHKQPNTLCGRCSVYDERGEPVAETGRYQHSRRVYVYPMRAAIARLQRISVPEGMPPVPLVLASLSSVGGSTTALVALLATDWPAMRDGGRAYGHVLMGLRRLRASYTVEPRIDWRRLRPKSEAQASAEAGA